MKEAPKKPSYHLDPQLEIAAVNAMCNDSKFYATIGHAIEPERLTKAVSKQLAQAAHAVAHRNGGFGSSWAPTIIQYLRDMMAAGKVTIEELDAAKDFFIDAAADLPSITTEELIAAVLPTIQKAKHKDALDQALVQRAPAAQIVESFEKVAKLGITPVASGSSMDSIVGSDDFFKEDETDLLKFGVQEIDDATGGLEHEALALFVGGSGAGKSMALIHSAVENYLIGRHVLYVSLELSVKRVAHRAFRNCVDMTKREVQLDPALAARRYEKVKASTTGKLVIAYAEPRVTSPRDIRRLIETEMRKDRDFNPTLFVIDFVDKIRTNLKEKHHDDMVQTTDGLRSLAVEAHGWTITASQATRQATNQPWLDLDDVADSMNKARSADLVIAIGRSEEDKLSNLVRYCIPKRREGEGANARIGPIPWDPEHGRISMINRSFPW